MTIVAPTFIFQDAVYDIFIENLNYIKNNLNELEPETYELAVNCLIYWKNIQFLQKTNE